MKTLTQSGLRDLLYSVRGATPVTISALTQVKTAKYPGLTKLARVNGMLAASYSASVSRKVGVPFESGPRPWGHRVAGCTHLVEHKGAFYLTLKVERALEAIYLARRGPFLKTVKTTEIADALPKPDMRPVTVRDYALAHIKRIAIGGQRYRVVADGTGMEP